MAKVIFLNGYSSSGKSSIAKAIQHIASVPFLAFGIDTMINMMPEQYLSFGEKSRHGCYFSVDQNIYGRTVSCHSGPYGQGVLNRRIAIIKTLLESNLDLIIDEVVWDTEEMNAYYRALEKHQLMVVKIFCCRQSAQEREFLRGDREIGLANDQFDRFEAMKFQYDIEINTDETTSFKAARQILAMVSDHLIEKRFN